MVMRALRRLLPLTGFAALLAVWAIGARLAGVAVLPGPGRVARALVELAVSGRLLRFAVASLFRVTWGWLAAVAVAVPLGLALGWYGRAARAFGPILHFARPVSPLAWIPLAILWFGVGDLA